MRMDVVKPGENVSMLKRNRRIKKKQGVGSGLYLSRGEEDHVVQ